MKIIMIVLLTAISTCYFTFTATKNHFASASISPSECIPVSQRVHSVEVPLAASKSQLVAEMHSDQMTAEPPVMPAVTQNENIEAVVAAREEQREHIEAFRRFVNAEHKKPLIEEANDRYHAEAVNTEWALAQENSLRLVFSESQELKDYIPSHMSCRSSACKIIIPVQDDTGANEAYSAAWRALSPMGNTVTYFSNPEKAETVLYVSQQGSNIF